MGWQCTGLRWPTGDGGPSLGWRRAATVRASALAYGTELGFRAVGLRRCTGARGHACPVGAVVPGRSTGARCPECARLDRAHSVAADTIADDPRTYRVYLAWFGPGMVKAGITAEERGAARLREQGAVVFSWLGRGPLMAARRTEELLRSALGVPDRIPYTSKRAVRAVLPGEGERRSEVAELYGRAVALEGAGWPETLERLPFEAVDHAGLFGLDGAVEVTCAVTELVDGGAVAGRLVAAAGPDLHLETVADGVVVLDTRLMTGWELTDADARTGVGVPVAGIGGGGVQDGLF
ncbi:MULTISPECIES: DUF2797 domain-containing protein [unclassified Streptomyces]|uniref:DUF2797 domain-containing protein n=1 Tax=unclassified Streptomyces TaxID=2593676 RepID=UPI00093F3B3A|nr:DUF2797 domain-containing protein [Streptomyces sp. CB01580]OKJ34508.1 hypothetical protein AMK22_18280 [Streptomyces sp. CB01580]